MAVCLTSIEAAISSATHPWVRVPTQDLRDLRSAYFEALREIQLLQERIDELEARESATDLEFVAAMEQAGME